MVVVGGVDSGVVVDRPVFAVYHDRPAIMATTMSMTMIEIAIVFVIMMTVVVVLVVVFLVVSTIGL